MIMWKETMSWFTHTHSPNRISNDTHKLQEMKHTPLPSTLTATQCLFPLHGELYLFHLVQFYNHKTPWPVQQNMMFVGDKYLVMV